MGHGHCQECGRRVRGQHPLLISKAFEVGTVHFGPRLLAFAAFQKMICGVSYDKIRLGFEQMLGFPVARSTLCRAMQRLARRAKPTRDALVEALRASPVVYADETGWKQGGRRVWLWVFTNLRETVYEILPGRGFEQAASVLGKNYAGTLGVDGWASYRCFKEATLQTCYNHLLHRCHELLETATRGAVRFPRLVKAILRHALALRDRRDAGEISPHGLRVAKGLLQAKMNRLLHGRFTNPANQRFAKHLRRYRDNLGSAEDGRLFCCGFFDYYNFHHRHSGIGLMTPADVHYGRAEQLTTARRQILLEAQQAHPERFVRGTPQPPVLPPQAWINPPLEKTKLHDAAQAPLAAASIPGVPPFSASRNQILVDVDVDRADLTSLPTIIEAH